MINDLKELDKLLKLLRKQGVTEFKMDSIQLKLGELPTSSSSIEQHQGDVITDDGFPRGITEEELMFYSVGGDVPAKDN